MNEAPLRVRGPVLLLALVPAWLPAPAIAETSPPETETATQLAAVREELAAFSRLDFSGYVQGRYEWHDDADYGLDASQKRPERGTSRFYVRRARLVTAYRGNLSEFRLQIDATGDGVVLKDAEASLVLTDKDVPLGLAHPWKLKLTVGQFKVPFGFEILQSSSAREVPERSAAARALVPGERDRGLRLQLDHRALSLKLAVINGTFISDKDHGTHDQNSWKDVAGRLGVKLGPLAIAASGHVGRFLKLVRAPTAEMPIAGYERYRRLRLGGDAQLDLDLPALGGLILRGEVFWARDTQLGFAGVPADLGGCKDATRLGFYAMAVKSLGPYLALAARLDQYDPVLDVGDGCAPALQLAVDQDRVTNATFALLGLVSDTLTLMLAYDHFGEQANQTSNDAVTLQFQARF